MSPGSICLTGTALRTSAPTGGASLTAGEHRGCAVTAALHLSPVGSQAFSQALLPARDMNAWCQPPTLPSSVAQGQKAPTPSLSCFHWLQVWTGFSAVTGYMLYRCSAKKIIDRHTPRLVSPAGSPNCSQGVLVSSPTGDSGEGGCTAMC